MYLIRLDSVFRSNPTGTVNFSKIKRTLCNFPDSKLFSYYITSNLMLVYQYAKKIT